MIGQLFKKDGKVWKITGMDHSDPHPANSYRAWNYILAVFSPKYNKTTDEHRMITKKELETYEPYDQ